MKLTVIAINEIVIDNKNNPDKFKVFNQILKINQIYLKMVRREKKIQELMALFKL